METDISMSKGLYDFLISYAQDAINVAPVLFDLFTGNTENINERIDNHIKELIAA